MLFIDLNATLIAGVMAQLSTQKNTEINEDLIRHLVLNIIRTHVKSYKKDYGQVVLCSDSRKYWRKEVFPHYKANRKVKRDESGLDWNLIHTAMNKFKVELKENFPYKFIEVEGAEADDIIGTMVPRVVQSENVLIISADRDFLQLQQYTNDKYSVQQYSPAQKKMLVSKVPALELKVKIITGDAGDGIPNILSNPDVFVTGGRQATMTAKRLSYFTEQQVSQYEDTKAQTGFSRNQMLIDLTMIPSDLKEKIINTVDSTIPAPRRKILDYFVEHRLKNLMEVIEEY